MNEDLNGTEQEKLKTWVKTQLDSAVWKLIDQGDIKGLMVEAKPAWALPFQILIGKIRAQDESKEFKWFICGEVPTDFLESTVATTPREAARHFAMKWQLQAARYQNSKGHNLSGPAPESSQDDPGNQLVDKAEALYALAGDAGLWQQQDGF
jgi:hypothetical protein